MYHLAFFRTINPAAAVFGALFLIEGLLLLVAGWPGRLHIAWTPTVPGIAGAAIVAYALVVYPVTSYLLGHRFPATPTFAALGAGARNA